jgi:hypothetical protein
VPCRHSGVMVYSTSTPDTNRAVVRCPSLR